jgi:ADP-ribose pyrophosphatase YjhB (NUDIX family)
MVSKFNIRVYGIWLKGDKILVSNENIDGFKMLKLPGGGLEFGEGPLDCVKREFREELGIDVEVIRLVHTSESFIQSAFRKEDQVIAIHYLVRSADTIRSMQTAQPTRLGGVNYHTFEWRELNKVLIEELTFGMDQQAIATLV